MASEQAASVIPRKAYEIHNDMVYQLGTDIEENHFQKLKGKFKKIPLTTDDNARIKDIDSLCDCLMNYETICVGNYKALVSKLENINPRLAGYVTNEERKIVEIINGGPSSSKKPRTGDQGQRQSTDCKDHFIMASNVNLRVIEHHNQMVLDIGNKIFGDDLVTVKRLFKGAPLTAVEISRIDNMGDLFECFITHEFVHYGRYENFVSQMKPHFQLVCTIVQTCAEDIQKLQSNLDDRAEITITMDDDKYRTNMGSPVFLDCSVKPTPESVLWKKGQQISPDSSIPCDNRKYYYGNDAPTLVIKKTNKTDESYYQCSAKRYQTEAVGDIVHLRIDKEQPGMDHTDDSLQSCSSSGSGATNISASMSDQRNSDSPSPALMSEHKPETTVPSTSVGMFDNRGCGISFCITNYIKRLVSLLQNAFTAATGEKKRIEKVDIVHECIRVQMEIKAARNPSEPSALYLAEEFKNYITDGGVIQLSDESNTVLDIDEASFRITPTHVPKDGLPFVSISHGEFTVSETNAAFLQTDIIASPAVTSIQWFRINNDDNQSLEIEIDNEKYFGSSNLSPTLIIKKVNVDDQGRYMCRATNDNGTGSSNRTFLRIKPDGVSTGDVVTGYVSTVKEEVSTVKEDVSTVKEDVSTVTQRQFREGGSQYREKEDVSTMTEDVVTVKEDVTVDLAAINVPSATTSHAKKIHPDLEPMIETTKAMITEEVKKTFIDTKAFRDAKEKLQNNRVVVIKGNTGDGKTCTAIQLLHWLIEEQHDRKPVQIHNMKDFELLAPKSKMVTFADNIFGENVLCEKEVQEWNKRINSVIPSLCGDLQTEANFLVITVRNEVFNSLKKRSFETVFTDLNIIDMSINTYKITEEKKELLDLYEPKNSTFLSWSKKEKEEIVKCAPYVGFPQCCRLFRDVPELQRERVQFFEKPLYFLNEALSKLGECPAILFLFLNDGMIKVKDLDPNSKQINKELLEEAFDIDLIDGDDDKTSLKYKKKVEFVKKSLDKLLGFLVVKGKHWWFDGGEFRNDDVYRFYHDSIYVAVALLYGVKTPIGYIQNCPRKSLSYITTSKTSTNMIVISSDHYTDMCERLLREFVSKENGYGTSIGSLDVWKDRVFVESFVRLLNDRKVDKCAVLNKACKYGAEDCALYLLSEGVKPDKDTPFCVVRGRCVNVLREILQYDVTPTARDDDNNNVLHQACELGREEMVTVLCDAYPHLVHDTGMLGLTPLYAAATRGNCCVFETVERTVRKSLCRVEDEQHKCETVDGRVVHVSCACAQYMSQLVNVLGRTVLHWSCMWGDRETCKFVWESYPALTSIVDEDGRHCLHIIAMCKSDVDLFTECETHVKQYLESTGREYDITTIRDSEGRSVLDEAKRRYRGTENNPLYDHLVKVFRSK